MTVLENLLLGAYAPALRPARAETLESVLVMFPALRGRQSQLAHTLSGGEQQMVAIGRALMSRPRFIMLDEPFLGLSPRLVIQVGETMRRINAAGVTVLFTEQAIQQSLSIADRGYILESGRLALTGTSAELLANGAAAAGVHGTGRRHRDRRRRGQRATRIALRGSPSPHASRQCRGPQ